MPSNMSSAKPWHSVVVAGAILGIVCVAPAEAANLPAYDDPEASLMSELVVVAPTAGPAWWKVSKGESVVWILGWPPVLTPEGLEWDRRALKRRLRGARAFLIPPRATVGFHREGAEPLPPEQAARVLAIAERRRLSLMSLTPPTELAVVRLVHAQARWEGIGYYVPPEIERMARRASVPVQRAGFSPVVDTASKSLSPADPAGRACLDTLLDELETPPGVFREAAEHWAKGSVSHAVAIAPRGMSICNNLLIPGFSRQLIESQTAAIAAALDIPGKAVAVAPMRPLLAEEGILARLRAQGYTVADPAKPLRE